MKQKKYSLARVIQTIFILGPLILSSCAYFNTYYNAKHYFEEGEKENENIEEGGRPQTANYQKSINSAARVIEYYPKSKYVDDAIMLMGKAYYAIRSYPNAKRKFEELLNNYPASPLRFEARLYLGKTLIDMRQVDEGITLLNNLWVEEDVPREIRLEGQRTEADYYYGKESYRQALSEYAKILQSIEDKRIRAEVQYQIGECYFQLGEYQAAEEAYKRVLDEKPTRKYRFDAIFKRALTLQKLGDLEGALRICDRLLKKDVYFSYYKDVYLAKAGVLEELGKQDEAIELYRKIIELYPRTDTSAEASYRLGQIYLHDLRDFMKAEEYLSKVRMEKAQSEFVEESQKQVGDLRYLQNLKYGIDSLKADIDTLTYRLEWMAENPQGEIPDSLLPDTTGETTPMPSPTPPELPSKPVETSAPPQYPTTPGHVPGGPPKPGQQMPGSQGFPYGPGMGEPGGQPVPALPQTTEPKPIRLKPLPSDSSAVYDRLANDAEALAEFRYRLAEHLWTQFDDLDSATVILTDLSEVRDYPDIRARALLSLYHLLAAASPDSTGPDSILEQIHQDYDGTEYDRWVRPRLGLELLPEPVDSAAELFRRAEELWTTEDELVGAIELYQEVTRRWPDSPWAPKALFAQAWIEEHTLEDIPSALASYDSLRVWYPQSPYRAIAEKKVAPPPPEVPDTTAAPGDTAAVAQSASPFGPAPPGSGAPELLGGEEAIQNAIQQNRLYPTVAAEAEIPGEVLLSFTVDGQGQLKNFEVLREDPEGFDFARMAIQALQRVRFRPAYRDGQFIESSATQMVRFTP